MVLGSPRGIRSRRAVARWIGSEFAPGDVSGSSTSTGPKGPKLFWCKLLAAEHRGHKWFCGAKGAALLHVSEPLQDAFRSHLFVKVIIFLSPLVPFPFLRFLPFFASWMASDRSGWSP